MMSKVVRRVTSDEAVLTIATASKGVVAERENGTEWDLLCINGMQRDAVGQRQSPLSYLCAVKRLEVGIIVHYWEAVGSSGKVPIPAIVSLRLENNPAF